MQNQIEMEKIQLSLMGCENLLYGSIVCFSIDDQEKSYKLLSKKSISHKLTKIQFENEELDSRCHFRIIPQSQYASHQRIKQLLIQDKLPLNNIQREYDLLMSEAEQNKINQSQLMGTDAKYWINVQIVHEDSKRFLNADSFTQQQVNKLYDPINFLDFDIKALTLSSNVSESTHFKLIPTCNFQSEGSGIISNGHYFYIMYTDQENKDYYLYDHQINGSFILSEAYKTAIRFSTVRESDSFEEQKTLRNSNNVILTLANENFYLNLKSIKELDPEKQEDYKKTSNSNFYVELEKYDEIKNIELSGFWVVELNEEFEMRMKLKNLLNGLYLICEMKNKIPLLSLSKDCTIDSDFEVIPINMKIDSIQDADKNLIFKLRTCPLNIDDYKTPYYLRNISSTKGSNNAVSDEQDNQRKIVSLGNLCELNKLDTFKFIFPSDQEFLEINFCADTMQHLNRNFQKGLEFQTFCLNTQI
eukprot:403371297